MEFDSEVVHFKIFEKKGEVSDFNAWYSINMVDSMLQQVSQ